MGLESDRPVYLLGISSSPRRNRNRDILLQELLRGAEEAGTKTEREGGKDAEV